MSNGAIINDAALSDHRTLHKTMLFTSNGFPTIWSTAKLSPSWRQQRAQLTIPSYSRASHLLNRQSSLPSPQKHFVRRCTNHGSATQPSISSPNLTHKLLCNKLASLSPDQRPSIGTFLASSLPGGQPPSNKETRILLVSLEPPPHSCSSPSLLLSAHQSTGTVPLRIVTHHPIPRYSAFLCVFLCPSQR